MKQEQVKEHFARHADCYEQLMVRLVPQYLEQHGIIAELLPDKSGPCRVLDLGCGNGILSELVFGKIPEPFVVGFDLTESMLQAYAGKLAAQTGRFELRQGDFRTDPLGVGYDLILAGLTLHHLTWPEREKFYHSLYGALNDGGILIARDIIIDEDPEVANDQYRLWRAFVKSRGEDPDFWYAMHRKKDHPPTLTDHFSWLRQAGFTKVACQWRLYNFAITTAAKR